MHLFYFLILYFMEHTEMNMRSKDPWQLLTCNTRWLVNSCEIALELLQGNDFLFPGIKESDDFNIFPIFRYIHLPFPVVLFNSCISLGSSLSVKGADNNASLGLLLWKATLTSMWDAVMYVCNKAKFKISILALIH